MCASMSARCGSSQGGSFRAVPRRLTSSSTVKPGDVVATSKQDALRFAEIDRLEVATVPDLGDLHWRTFAQSQLIFGLVDRHGHVMNRAQAVDRRLGIGRGDDVDGFLLTAALDRQSRRTRAAGDDRPAEETPP